MAKQEYTKLKETSRNMYIDTLLAHRHYIVYIGSKCNGHTVQQIISDFDEFDLWDMIKKINVDVINCRMHIEWSE